MEEGGERLGCLSGVEGGSGLCLETSGSAPGRMFAKSAGLGSAQSRKAGTGDVICAVVSSRGSRRATMGRGEIEEFCCEGSKEAEGMWQGSGWTTGPVKREERPVARRPDDVKHDAGVASSQRPGSKRLPASCGLPGGSMKDGELTVSGQKA